MKNPVQINVSTLTQQVNDGMKKPQLAEFYGIPVSQMGLALKQAGLKIRKFHAPAFALVSDVIMSTDNVVDTLSQTEIAEQENIVENVVETPALVESAVWED
jgi:uncharacterized lipoprotein